MRHVKYYSYGVKTQANQVPQLYDSHFEEKKTIRLNDEGYFDYQFPPNYCHVTQNKHGPFEDWKVTV